MDSQKLKSLAINLDQHTTMQSFLQATIIDIIGDDGLREGIYSELQSLPWEECSRKIAGCIEEIADNFPETRGNDEDLEFPPEGLTGLYFCLGDDARSLCLCGSSFFDEEDWAAQADYYPEHEFLEKWCSELRDLVEDALYMEEKKSSLLSEAETDDVFFCLLAHIIFHSMKNMSNKQALLNTGIAVGYSSGNEFMLGNFVNGTFCVKFRDFQEEGYTKPPREFPTIVKETPERGPVWSYVHTNYRELLKEEKLLDQFYTLDESGAKEIASKLRSQMLINTCQLCGNIKKTPRARLCLQCGDFTEEYPKR